MEAGINVAWFVMLGIGAMCRTGGVGSADARNVEEFITMSVCGWL